MNPQRGISAADWLKQAAETEIVQVLHEYGEEHFARRIARAIVVARQEKPLATGTLELARCIAGAVPFHEPGKHPATRSFQAIRIFINRGIIGIAELFNTMFIDFKRWGRLAVISFHSLEDQIVKQFMQNQARGDAPDKLPLRETQIVRRLRIVSRLIRPGGGGNGY